MPAEITMPQLSDTMTEGTLIKWHKREGDKVAAGEEIAEIETDKATMPMEAFESGTLALIKVEQGHKVAVGDLLGVIATGSEKVDDIRQKYAASPQRAPSTPTPPTRPPGEVTSVTVQTPVVPPRPSTPIPIPSQPKPTHQYDLIVIGGGPAGYAAAIRAAQLKKRVLCVEKENLGGTCLNWGCIPTKALLEDGAFVRRLRTEAASRGVSFDNLKVDFPTIVQRSRGIALKLQRGIGSLFKKYGVKHILGTGQLLAPHRVKAVSSEGTQELTAEHVIIATGARSTPLPGVEFDGRKILTARDAMILPAQPKRIAIIGAGAIGCEFADFYHAVGTEVTVIEMLPHLLPNEDEDVSILLERSFAKRGIRVLTRTKTDKVEKTDAGVRLTVSGQTTETIDADVVLVAIGVMGNVEGVAAADAKLELFKNRIKVDHEYRTNLPNVWSVGDCISLHWPVQMGMGGYRHPDLAHVAHHEAINCVERIFGVSKHGIDYRQIPGCTYTHPQVASMGANEKKLREDKRDIRVGKFPFSASGRALAAGESEGFVKLIFDAKYGELLGVHMIGENVTELLAELVMAKKLEATEAEIIEAMHPHPTMSEAVMEAAGVADGRAIHL